MVYSEYTWIFVCGIFLSLFMAYGIGANDVANAFGSSVGAKALTMKQAIVIAAICEFGGAALLGSGVTTTIRSNIANISYYVDKPDLFMYGMLCALLAGGIWLLLATYLELPVSTTHSIVGAIIGFSVVAAGWDSVVWSKSKTSFPYLEGVSIIVISWFTSPILSAIAAVILFLFTRHAVLRRKNCYKLSLWLLPLMAFFTSWIGCFFIIQKAPKLAGKVGDAKNAWISTCVAAGISLFSAVIGVPLIRKRVEREWDELSKAEVIPDLKPEAGGVVVTDVEKNADAVVDDVAAAKAEAQATTASQEIPLGATHPERTPAMLKDLRKSKMFGSIMYSSNVEVHDIIAEDATVNDVHNNAEVFDRKTEVAFKYLQVFTACCNSFSHGSNDVANAMGPFAAIYGVWDCTCVNTKSAVPIWILIMGGVGIVAGLATYGYKIMRVLGVKMTKLTNSRGYCVELAAAVVIIVGSRYGLPLSTTHCMVGAVTGIGLTEMVSGRRPEGSKARTKAAFNWLLLIKFFCGWVATLVVAALTTAAFTAQGIYAPNKNDTNERVTTAEELNTTGNSIAASLYAQGQATNNQTLLDLSANITATCGENQTPLAYLQPAYDCVNTSIIAYESATTWYA